MKYIFVVNIAVVFEICVGYCADNPRVWSMGISIIRIRRSHGRLSFIQRKTVFIL